MKLVALQSFGSLQKGDTVDVPDGASFAPDYFAEYQEGETPETPASSSPVAEGLSNEPEPAEAPEPKEEG